MVHFIKIALLASVAVLPALAAPLNAETNELVAREPARHRRAPSSRRDPVTNVANRVNSVVSAIGSTAGRIGSVAGRVGSAISRIKGLFGRELDEEEELFLRDLLEEFDAREPGEFEDELEAREVFYDELD
jgi:hypothetical protein